MGLKLYDLDLARKTLMVRHTKGKKDRMVPVGERALDWTEKYITDVRPGLVCEPDEGTLFVTSAGETFTANHPSVPSGAQARQSRRHRQDGLLPHLFRHTMATLMLEGGADVRFIQEMLGHANLETTQIYTQVSIRKLQEIHAATHSSAKRGHYEGPEGDEDRQVEAESLLAVIANEEEEAAETTEIMGNT